MYEVEHISVYIFFQGGGPEGPRQVKFFCHGNTVFPILSPIDMCPISYPQTKVPLFNFDMMYAYSLFAHRKHLRNPWVSLQRN